MAAANITGDVVTDGSAIDIDFHEWPEPSPITLVDDHAKRSSSLVTMLTSGTTRWYFLAIVPVLFGSTGPIWFRLMGDSFNGILKACWRMQCAALLLLPLAIFDVIRMSPTLRRDMMKTALRVGIPVGTVMGAHFSFVGLGTNATSFAHAVVTMNVSPLFFSSFVILRYFASVCASRGVGGFSLLLVTNNNNAVVVAASSTSIGNDKSCINNDTVVITKSPSPLPLPFLHPSRSRPLTFLEILGSSLSIIGVMMLVAGDTKGTVRGGGGTTDPAPNLLGDIYGLLASLTMATYLSGGTYRGNAPIYIWMFTLHIVAAIATGLVFLASGGQMSLLFFWLQGGFPLFGTLGAAFFPSLLGHTIVNYLTAGRLPTFTMSLFLMLQPVTGNLIAWALNIQGFPGPLAVFSIPLVMYGGYIATVGSSKPHVKSIDVLLCR